MELTYLRQHPKVRLYMARVKREVLDDTVHKKIMDDILLKVNVSADAQIKSGASDDEAVSRALAESGKPAKVGKMLNKRYKLAYYDSHYVRRFFYNCIGLITVFAFMIIFSSFINIPYPYMLLILSIIAGLSAWLTFKRFLKTFYIILNIFMVPAYIIYTVILDITDKIKVYNNLVDFGKVTYPFVIEFGLYTIQFATMAILAATGIFVTLWLFADEYLSTRATKYIKAGIAVLTAITLFFTVGYNTKNRQFLESKAYDYSVEYWAALKKSGTIVNEYEKSTTITDFPIYISLVDMSSVIDSYNKTYGKPSGYNLTASTSVYFKSVQNFLYKTSSTIERYKGKVPNFTNSERITLVREFLGKLETERQRLSDYKEDNSRGLITIASGIQSAYNEFLAAVKQRQLQEQQQ